MPILRSDPPVSRQRQWGRRAAILACARTHLAREGFDGVVMRDIAEECEISMRTLYNTGGDKGVLLGEAVVEYAIASSALALNQTEYPNFPMALADTYWRNAVRHRDFIRAIILAYFPPRRPLQDSIDRCTPDAILTGLLQMRRDRLLRPGVNPRELGTSIALMIRMVTLNALTGKVDDQALRYEMLTSTARLLMSATTYSETERTEEWLSRTLTK